MHEGLPWWHFMVLVGLGFLVAAGWWITLKNVLEES
jgi:hypothetical protein